YNDSAATLAERRARDAERKRRGRETQQTRASARRPRGHEPDSGGSPPSVQAASDGTHPTRPIPTEPPPQPPAGGGSRRRRHIARARQQHDQEVAAWLERHPCTPELAAQWQQLRGRIDDDGLGIMARGYLDVLHPHRIAESADG